MREGNKIIGYVVEREPEWDSEQVALVRAVDDYERSLGRHGHPFAEATSALADPNNPTGEYVYVAGVLTDNGRLPLIDYAEKARLDAEESYRKRNEKANLNGVVFPVSRVERAASA